MSKEWLEDWLKDKKEQLRSATVFINENGNEAVEVSLSVLNKLFEQAERVIELEQQNKRLREALEFYANKETYESVLINEAQYDADGICISNDEYYPPTIYFDNGETARKALEGEELKTLVSVTFNGTSSEHIFDVPKDEFKVMWNEQIEQVGYFESIDTEGRTVIINPKQCPVIVMYDLND